MVCIVMIVFMLLALNPTPEFSVALIYTYKVAGLDISSVIRYYTYVTGIETSDRSM